MNISKAYETSKMANRESWDFSIVESMADIMGSGSA